ncbi:hypothetical protein [Halomonas sp. H5]|uniref:hypothetical protein n=1 Tax=Halomonas sp. H5 TaxID=3423910 RepID=UPI003D3697FD
MTGYIAAAIAIFIKIPVFIWISHCVFILPGKARKFRKNNFPTRELSINEYRLLKRYYPKEKFFRGVWEFDGTHETAATWGDWEGREVIKGIPVTYHSSAESSLRRKGKNKVEVAMGKKKAYIIRLNDRYSITGHAEKVEAHERFWDQWMMGLPGAIEGHEDLELVGQRSSTKREQFHQAYRYAPELAGGYGLRFTGVFLSSTGLALLWLIHYNSNSTNTMAFVAAFIAAVAGAFFISLPAHAMSSEQKVNIVKGKYKGLSEEGIKLGGMKFRVNDDKRHFFSSTSINRLIRIDVYSASNMVIGIDNRSFFEDDSVSKDKEPIGAALLMMALSFLSVLSAHSLDFEGRPLLPYSIFIHLNSFMGILYLLVFLLKVRSQPSPEKIFLYRKAGDS